MVMTMSETEPPAEPAKDARARLRGAAILIGACALVFAGLSWAWHFLTLTPAEQARLSQYLAKPGFQLFDRYLSLWAYALTHPLSGLGWILGHFVWVFFLALYATVKYRDMVRQLDDVEVLDERDD